MKLNLESGVKLEIKRSEINELSKSYQYLMSSDEELKNVAVELILGILPGDKTVGVVFTNDISSTDPILYFLKMAKDPNDNIEIKRESWIIEEDVE